MATALLSIDVIRIDGGTQPRTRIDQGCVDEYAEHLEDANKNLPSVEVFHDGAEYWLADGFHRYHAYRKAGRSKIAADVRNGTQRDAILFSCGANATHGLRRTNEDKRKAASTLLQDPEWSKWSDLEISRRCRVSNNLVGTVRKELLTLIKKGEESEPRSAKRTYNTKHGTPATMNTENMGRPKKPPKEDSAAAGEPPPASCDEEAKEPTKPSKPPKNGAPVGFADDPKIDKGIDALMRLFDSRAETVGKGPHHKNCIHAIRLVKTEFAEWKKAKGV